MYKALEYFTDLQDNSYAYNAGDTYPRAGYEPTASRIEQLASSDNARNRPVIVKVDVEVEQAVEETVEKKPNKRKRSK